MAWIESHQEIARHPKTRKLARLLGVSVPTAIGHLHLLWWWAVDYAPDGCLTSFDAAEIADACMWDGEADKFLDALSESHFVDAEPLAIHDWDEYAGRLVLSRAKNKERKRQSRARHAPVTSDTAGRHGATQPNTTQHNSTQQNHREIPAPQWLESLREIKGFPKDPLMDSMLVVWIEGKKIPPAHAEETALALASKWDPKKWKDIRATFKNWVVRPPLARTPIAPLQGGLIPPAPMPDGWRPETEDEQGERIHAELERFRAEKARRNGQSGG